MPWMPDDPVLAQVRVERHPRAPARRERAGFLHDEAGQPRPPRLDVLRVDAVVADQGVGHADHLSPVRRIGEDLLVAGHGRVEHDLAVALAGGAEGFAAEDAAVGEREQDRPGHGATLTPPTRVIHGAPVPVSPANGVLRPRERNAAGSTVQLRSRSRIVTSAAAPGARLPPGRFRSRAGPVLSRAHQGREVEHARPHQAIEQQRHRGLEAHDAVGRLRELTLLLGERVRRVVGGHAVDGAVHQRFHARLDVALAAQRGRHLAVGVVAAHDLVGEQQVMRGHLRGHPDAARLGVAHEPHRARGGDVGDVQVRPGQLGEDDVARHHHVLGGGGLAGEPEIGGHEPLVHGPAVRELAVLRVADDRHAEGQGVLHRPAVELRVHHALAVVGEGDAAGLGLLGQLRELRALEVAAHRADRIHADDAFDLRAGQDVVGDRAVVVDRERVGHARDRGEAARRGGPRAARDRLLVLEARLAQVHVHVDEARAHHLAGRVHRLGARGRLQALAHLVDAAVRDPDVLHRVGAAGRIHHAPAPDQQVHALLLPASM